jgi:intracellular multiplication protein IcmQ
MSNSVFFSKNHKYNPLQNEITIGRQLVGTLEALLKAGDWQSSLLVQTISKQLKSYCDEIQQWLDSNSNFVEQSKNILEQTHSVDQITVYISLFQTEGNNLQKWTNILKMLDHYSQTRPVYLKEEDVRAMISTKIEMQREAYVIVKIKRDAIIPLSSGRTAVLDRLGNGLVNLKRGAIKSEENIIEFVHGPLRYNFKEGQLTLQQEEQEETQFNMAAQAA